MFIAMLAYREWGRKRGITNPNIVASQTAHVAFDKAAFYLGMEIRKVPILEDFSCDVEGLEREIDSNTVCIIASSPEFPFGRFDPVTKIAAIAKSRGIGCHSDCCLGGFIDVFTEEAGFKIPYKFDF